MRSEWNKTALSEIASFTTGKLNSNASVENGKYPFFTCSPETLRINDYAFDQAAILLAGNNAEGNFNIKFYSGKFNAYQRTYVFSAKNNCNLKYLYYSLRLCLDNFKRISQGTATKFLTAKILNSFEIMLPSIDTQKRIAAILSAIDDKIELNTAINENLEQQAQAIFKSWFVDFEPFGGYIPSNWTQTTLGNVCVCELGGTPSRAKSEYWNGSIPWINSGEINNFRIIKPSETITDLGLNKSATKLLPSKTTVIAITGATLGQVSLLEIASCANQSVVGVVPNERIPYEFIYPYIKAHIQELISHQTGGAQQHINKQNVESLPIIVPTEDSFKKYVDFVGGLYFAIANNCFENERLAELRDSLLPKLMNGEIDVSRVQL